MASPDGRAYIVFNGEVYNHPELRAELERAGHSFISESDAEVVLAAYREWGSDAFRRFVGMWSLLIVDLVRESVIGCRDRFGIRPMFYAISGGRTLIASEIKQLLPLLNERKPDDAAMYDYLRYGTVNHHGDRTFFAEVRVPPPACWFEISLRHAAPALTFHRYWELSRTATPEGMSEVDAVAETERLLKQSVASTLRTPARSASFLSGGLDSSLITALMREVDPRTRAAESYSLVFDRGEYAAFDESGYIDDFVRHTGVANERTTFDAAWLREHLPIVTRTQEEPLVASAQVAQYRVCELAARRGARVVLDGQGADEIFSGYPHHEWLAWRDRVRHGDRAVAAEVRILREKYGVSASRVFMQQLVVPALQPFLRRRPLLRSRYAFIDRRFFGSSEAFARGHESELALARAAGGAGVDRLMDSDVRGFGLKPILLHGDRAAMAHSIETRLPYLDHRLVEFVASVPVAFRVGMGERKRLLRGVAAGRLPASMLKRRDKMGFLTPEPLWLRRELAPDVLALTTDDRLHALPHLDGAQVSKFLKQFLDGSHHDARAVWRLWALKHWIEQFDVR